MLNSNGGTIYVGINVSINVGMNVSLNNTEKEVVKLLIENGNYTADDLSEKISVTTRTVERAFKSLQDKNILTRIGSKRDGTWIITR